MRAKSLKLSTIALTSIALISGCAAPQQGGTILSSAATARATSQSSGELLYVSVWAKRGGVIEAFDPTTRAEVYTIKTRAFGLCSDSAGDIFATSEDGGLLEYAHGGNSPIAEINYSNYPQGCAIDPKTRNLAAVALFERRRRA